MGDAAEKLTEKTEDTTIDETTEHWSSSVKDESLKGTLSKFESPEKLLDTIGYKPDWRKSLPDDLKKTAERFTSVDDAIRSVQDLRKRESLVRVPGKNATEEEVSAYRKAVGIPFKPEEYTFPDLPEGVEMTDDIKVSRETWGKRFHELGMSKDAATKLMTLVNEDVSASMQAEIKADEAFAKSQEDALRSEWKGEDYDKNKQFANRAFAEISNRAGISTDELSKIQTKNGRFLMDDSRMLKLFSVIGREMSEGVLGSTMTESEMDTAEDQISDIRKQIAEAQSAGDSKKANRLFQKEQALIAKIKGNKPIVGAGRAT